MYDKQEEQVLTVIEELKLVNEAAKLSGSEVLKEYGLLRNSLDTLEAAYVRNHNQQIQAIEADEYTNTKNNSNNNNSSRNNLATNSNSRATTTLCASPTAKVLIQGFDSQLSFHLITFRRRIQECDHAIHELRNKMTELVKYFGEDVHGSSSSNSTGHDVNNLSHNRNNNNSNEECDSCKIFGVLKEFLQALSISKANMTTLKK